MSRPSCPYPQFTIADYTITVIPMGRLALDGGAMFGVVPKVLWEKLITCDDRNRIPLSMNCLLVEYQNQRCLLDTGAGTKFDLKHQDMYGIENTASITDYLAPLNLSSKDITKVMFTHLHFDHAGGATSFDKNGKTVATFENAQYIVHRGEWEDALSPTPKSKASYLKENFMPLEESGQLMLIDGTENEILPGLKLKVTGGHTAYHQVLILDTPEGGFIYWGDLIPTSRHIKVPYVMAYDLYPVDTMAKKEELLKEAYEKNWLNFFEHDLDVPACYLAYNEEKGFYFAKNPVTLALSQVP